MNKAANEVTVGIHFRIPWKGL